ncbi:MAG: phytanoyl-CoA dioxygenase family protein [Bacteroidota bacterium]
MDYEKCAIDFWENGYLVMENFYPAELMNYLNEVILNHFGMKPEWEHTNEFIEKSATEVIPWFPFREGNMEFEPAENDPRLLALTESILGKGWDNLYCMAMFSKKGTRGQAWHQDCPPENPDQFNLNRLFYTHDITEETGGKTIVMPKTHKTGELTKGIPHEDMDGQVVLAPKKGTLVILHGHTWHRVLPVNGEYRVSVNCRSVPKNTPENITDVAVYRNMRYRFSTSEIIEERY